MVVARTAESLMGRVIGADLAASALKAENATLRYWRQVCLYMIANLLFEVLNYCSNCTVRFGCCQAMPAWLMLCICGS